MSLDGRWRVFTLSLTSRRMSLCLWQPSSSSGNSSSSRSTSPPLGPSPPPPPPSPTLTPVTQTLEMRTTPAPAGVRYAAARNGAALLQRRRPPIGPRLGGHRWFPPPAFRITTVRFLHPTLLLSPPLPARLPPPPPPPPLQLSLCSKLRLRWAPAPQATST